MKIIGSAVPLAIFISACTLSGCVSDNSTAELLRPSNNASMIASANSPAGIWLVSGSMTEDVNQSGNEIMTQTESRQLIVIEAIGNKQYRLHECSLGLDVHYPATHIELNDNQLKAASSFTNYDNITPYNESEEIKIRLNDNKFHGTISSYDRNLDGSYDGRQVAYIEGIKISHAQSLEALSQNEMDSLLGSDTNRHANADNLGHTCAGIAMVETNGTQRTAELGSVEIAKLIGTETQSSVTLSVASSASDMVASGESN